MTGRFRVASLLCSVLLGGFGLLFLGFLLFWDFGWCVPFLFLLSLFELAEFPPLAKMTCALRTHGVSTRAKKSFPAICHLPYYESFSTCNLYNFFQFSF